MKTAVLLVLVAAVPVSAQEVTYRGFAEFEATSYPLVTPQDDDRILVDGRFSIESAYRPLNWLTLAGSIDARVDNLQQVESDWRLDVLDRRLRRPALSLRHGVATLRKGTLSLDVGRQFIRWGKADILNPTDRFAPRDFLEVTDDAFLAVTGARVQYERGAHVLDVAWVPFFTPSRTPLLGRRWAPLPPGTFGPVEIEDLPSEFPERPQYGARWNVLAPGFDFSLSYFNGFNHLPQFTAFPLSSRPVIALQRSFAPLRMAGGDAAVPLPWFTVKGEVASLVTTSRQADNVVLYVVQLERQTGELSLVGGYAGEVVTERRSELAFAPERGLTRAFLGRAGYTISATRDVSVESAIRQNLDGVWVKGQYSEALDAHWRFTVAGVVIFGDETDFIGQYERNSHLTGSLRYSF